MRGVRIHKVFCTAIHRNVHVIFFHNEERKLSFIPTRTYIPKFNAKEKWLE